MVPEPRTAGELLRHVYEEVSRGDSRPLVEALSDDVVWTIMGSTPLSGTHRGKQDVLDRLFGGLRQVLASPVVFSVERVIEEGEHAVLIATGATTTITGRPYNNSYCIVARVVDGRFVELTDYVDTELVRALFDDER